MTRKAYKPLYLASQADLAKPLFGIEDVYGENRTKYLELLIGACYAKEGRGK